MLILFLAASAVSAQQADLGALFSRPIDVERSAEVDEIGFDWRMNKVFVEASVEGQAAEFIFDTGSPSMISRALADTLELTYVGQNTGVDANGQPLTMDIAVVDMLTLGGTKFRQVPVMVFDFSGLPNGQCLIDGGIIGSEILGGSAWQIDLEDRVLRIAEEAARFEHRPVAHQAALGDFGYPHYPIIEYAIGDLNDRALFDTGSAEVVTLYEQVADARTVRRRVQRRSLSEGRGSEGESAGGVGDMKPLIRATLDGFELGETQLDDVRFTTRGAPPTLLGAGLLRDYIVTLDYPGRAFSLSPRETPDPVRVEAGYGIAFTGERAAVVQLFEQSQADRSGLELGDIVLQIGERDLDGLQPEARCEAVNWLTTDFDPTAAVDLIIEREGERQTLSIPATAE